MRAALPRPARESLLRADRAWPLAGSALGSSWQRLHEARFKKGSTWAAPLVSIATDHVGNTMTAPLPPPGWYPDRGGANTQRYFDGTK